MKSWKCQICGKEGCWSLWEINRGPAMCRECQEERLEEEVKGNEAV